MTDEGRHEPRPGEDSSPWSEYRRLILSELERLNKEIATVRDLLRSVDQRLAALDDRTTGQRTRLAALENQRPAGQQSTGSWITLDRVLIAGVLIGLAFARLGIDPTALVK